MARLPPLRIAQVVLMAILSLLLALVVFNNLTDLMWRSDTWNGQDAAFRMFSITALALVIPLQPDRHG